MLVYVFNNGLTLRATTANWCCFSFPKLLCVRCHVLYVPTSTAVSALGMRLGCAETWTYYFTWGRRQKRQRTTNLKTLDLAPSVRLLLQHGQVYICPRRRSASLYWLERSSLILVFYHCATTFESATSRRKRPTYHTQHQHPRCW